jgi:hypothetical protein
MVQPQDRVLANDSHKNYPPRNLGDPRTPLVHRRDEPARPAMDR